MNELMAGDKLVNKHTGSRAVVLQVKDFYGRVEAQIHGPLGNQWYPCGLILEHWRVEEAQGE